MADFGGRYRRVRPLGAGAMGEVWLAHDEGLGDRPVAIKIMHPWRLASQEDVVRFQREMRLASGMQHPNIVTVFTAGTDNGVPFMVMEYLEGRDLSKALRSWGPGHAAGVGREACAALAYAHGLGVVHRDIKPGNLFLCDSGPLKVTDFGIAKAVGGTKVTATGTVIGTFRYIAPEQWLGEPAAFSSDIWAVGCVLYELLSGSVPREYTEPAGYVAAAARAERVPPLAAVTGTPAWLSEAVQAMLQLDPRDRPTADECVQLLENTHGRHRAPLARKEPPPERAPGPTASLVPAAPEPGRPAQPTAVTQTRTIPAADAQVQAPQAGATKRARDPSASPGAAEVPQAGGLGHHRPHAEAAVRPKSPGAARVSRTRQDAERRMLIAVQREAQRRAEQRRRIILVSSFLAVAAITVLMILVIHLP